MIDDVISIFTFPHMFLLKKKNGTTISL